MFRKVFIIKALIKYYKNIKKNKYKWLNYDEFKKLENKVIKENYVIFEIDFNNLITSINDIAINSDNEVNNDFAILKNEIIESDKNNNDNVDNF